MCYFRFEKNTMLEIHIKGPEITCVCNIVMINILYALDTWPNVQGSKRLGVFERKIL